VRELENCIERAVLTTRDACIHSYNLPAAVQTEEFAEDPFGGGNTSLSLDEQIAAFERRLLEDALNRHGGSHSAAARELGLSPRMMSYRLSRSGSSAFKGGRR
jgi:Nif-specific regulatory protein